MNEFPLTDRLLAALRRARPTEAVSSPADSPEAFALRDRLLAIDRSDPITAIDSPALPQEQRARRQRVLVSAAAVIVAIGGVVSGVLFTAQGNGPKRIDAKTVDYLTSAALDHANADGIAYTHAVLSNSAGTVTSIIDTWRYDGSVRIETFNAGGSPLTDTSSENANGTRTGRLVNYRNDTWFTISKATQVTGPPNSMNSLRSELVEGHFNVVAETTLDGRRVLELTRAGALSSQTLVSSNMSPASGNSGNSGNSGTTGNSGVAGNSGTTGNSGTATAPVNCPIRHSGPPSGNSGVAGSSGNSGVTGNSGNSGVTGNSGTSGNSGVAGNSGFMAVEGTPGVTTPARSEATAARLGKDGTISVQRFSKTTAVALSAPPGAVWIDPATCLPVQIANGSRTGTSVKSTFQWLAPTTANLALLLAPIPSGFSEVSTPIQQLVSPPVQKADR